MTLKLVNSGTNQESGSRLFLMAPGSTTNYQTFNPIGKEFSFDVDVSHLPCGTNGAIYFTQMDADGGMARYPSNKAGGKFGTGYCDSQCPKSLKFINGLVSNALTETCLLINNLYL
jgi:cellulose 1,4-beta-cellobiosidase